MEVYRAIRQLQTADLVVLVVAVLSAGAILTGTGQQFSSQQPTGNVAAGVCSEVSAGLLTNCTDVAPDAAVQQQCGLRVVSERDIQFDVFADGEDSHNVGTTSTGEPLYFTRDASKFDRIVAVPVNPDTGERCRSQAVSRIVN